MTLFSRRNRLPRIEGMTDTAHMRHDLNLPTDLHATRGDFLLTDVSHFPR